MKQSCLLMPREGTDTFVQLKREFGHKKAAYIFNRVVTKQFIDKYGDALTLDSEGVPTFSSIVKLPVIQKYLGEEQVLGYLNRQQNKVLPNTLENVNTLVHDAADINKADSSHVAIVDYTEEGKLTIKIVSNTKQNRAIAENQLAIQKLNNTVASMLSQAGVTVGHMSRVEIAAGKVGEINFNHAKDIASEFTGLIRVANNMIGSLAISEEFSHLLVEIYKDLPLVQRAITYLKNPEHAREVLGDLYQEYYDEYNGDIEQIAEEAAGHMLREQLLNTSSSKRPSLFTRVKSAIVNMFKGINPGYYQDSIDAVKYGMSKVAQDIINRKLPLTKEQIAKAARNKKFNALSAKEEIQRNVIKTILERMHREAQFVQNTEEGRERFAKKKVATAASTLSNQALSKEETMEAIYKLIEVSSAELKKAYEGLNNLDTMELKDKFIVLANALHTLEANGRSISEMYSILGEDFFQDVDILNQKFMILDQEDSLKEFRSAEPIEQINTADMQLDAIAQMIVRNSENIELSPDGEYYINRTTGEKYFRSTQLIQAYFEGEVFDPNNPWTLPSTNIGTGVDEMVRDFMQGRITFNADTKNWEVEGTPIAEVYPNATQEHLNAFAAQLSGVRHSFNRQGIHIIPRDVTIEGTVDVTDGRGNTHIVRVAGTLDLLGYDNQGNWYIYDMKTHRGEIDQDKKDKYARQLTLYKKFLEDKYGISIASLQVIPIQVHYPDPIGSRKGTAQYSVSQHKPEKYNGREGNQLIVNGQNFKGASPYYGGENIELDTIDPNVSYAKLTGDPTNGLGNVKAAILNALSATNSQYKMLESLFMDKSLEEFVAFLKPFVGETMEISDGKGGLRTASIEEIVRHSGRDISTIQHLFITMADNPDALLKIFDHVVKVQKAEQRFNTIDMSQRIAALAKEYESKGITSYDWMFEEDNDRYINKTIINGKDMSYNRSAYEAAYKNYKEQLDNQFGKHPIVGSKEYNGKKRLLNKWIQNNTIKVEIEGKKTAIPNPTKYPSRYSGLSQTKKEFYDKWMGLKSELDMLLPRNATTLTNTIKIRKNGFERASSLIKKGDFEGLAKEARSSYMRSFDDTYNYNGYVGLNDEEVLKLPLYYLHGKDTSDLTHDVIGSLMAYADMAYNYNAMQAVLNPLEIGRNWVMNKRQIEHTSGGRSLRGRTNIGMDTSNTRGYVDPKKSKFGAALNDFFESKIYEKFLIDNGEIGGVDVNKAAGLLLKLGSTIQLGFNELAHAANLGTGLAMQNIEAAAGQYFNRRELASADQAFFSELPSYLGDIGQRIPESKLALFHELFNIKRDFRKNIKNKDFVNKMLVTRLFGPRLQFLGQDAGDFWLYSRTAIAMAHRLKLKDANEKEISLWDALVVVPVNPEHPEYGKKLVIKEGVKMIDGSDFNRSAMGSFSRRVGDVNVHLFGVYNDEDLINVRRHLWGRFIMQYRDWIPAQYNYRWGKLTTSLDSGEKWEGYNRTTVKFLWGLRKELTQGGKNLEQVWNELEDYQKANIKRTLAEVRQLACVNFICMLLGSRSKDKDRAWVESALRALMYRERTELGALTVGIQMPREFVNIIKSPVAASSIMKDVVDTANILNPWAYTDEIKSGDYKGHSTAYKSLMESPVTLWYRNLKKTANPDIMERYYQNLK